MEVRILNTHIHDDRRKTPLIDRPADALRVKHIFATFPHIFFECLILLEVRVVRYAVWCCARVTEGIAITYSSVSCSKSPICV